MNSFIKNSLRFDLIENLFVESHCILDFISNTVRYLCQIYCHNHYFLAFVPSYSYSKNSKDYNDFDWHTIDSTIS